MDLIDKFLENLYLAYGLELNPRLQFWLTVALVVSMSLAALVATANGCLDLIIKIQTLRRPSPTAKKKKRKRAKKD